METRVETQSQVTTRPRVSWNKGKLIGPKAPLKLKERYAIDTRLQIEKRIGELALFNLAIDSKLRGCDLVKLRVCGVVQGNRMMSRTMVMHPLMTSDILRQQEPYEVATTSSCRTARASSSTSRPAMGGRAR